VRAWMLVLAPLLGGTDDHAALRARLLPPLDDAQRVALLTEAVGRADPAEQRLVAQALRMRDSLAAQQVTDPVVIAAYVDAALSPDPSLRDRASVGATWGGRLTVTGAIDRPTDDQLAKWADAHLALQPVVWAVAAEGTDVRWLPVTSTPHGELTVDPKIQGYEGPNVRGGGLPQEGLAVVRAGQPVLDLAEADLGVDALTCGGQRVILAYEVAGERKALLTAAAVMSPGGNAGGPAAVVGCSAVGAPDRPAPIGKEAAVRWPCAPDALSPDGYAPVLVPMPPRPDTCLAPDALASAVDAANVRVLASLGMDRFRLPPASLPSVTLPAAQVPSFAEEE